jgi:hypothetical protein
MAQVANQKAFTVIQRLRGCPTGATHDALLLHHTEAELAAALVAGEVATELRTYAKPRNFQVRWFYAKEPVALAG